MNKEKDPPSLSYLAIYNPTLQHPGPIPEDDEDAEEQGHVLFYTSRDRAASRDQMLRRVGLGKALINFAELLQADSICDNVHSLSKRMVMLSPEPNFWILAGIDLARSIKVDMDKGKDKAKVQVKGKGKEQSSQLPNKSAVQYDYYEGSLSDLALKASMKMGYEQFKLTHGSFETILSTLGREALELQLERFFTVWAWSWEFEDGQDFSEHLGTPLHPMHLTLSPLINEYQTHVPENCSTIIIYPPYVIPSTKFIGRNYSSSLSRHLLSLVPQRRPVSPPKDLIEGNTAKEGTLKGNRIEAHPAQTTTGLEGMSSSPSKFLGMPTMGLNMNMNMTMGVSMDVRKWGWPGYLTFGKGTARMPVEDPAILDILSDPKIDGQQAGQAGELQESIDFEVLKEEEPRSVAITIDQDALNDAITTADNSYSNRSDISNTLTENLSSDEDLLGSTLTARPRADSGDDEAITESLVTKETASSVVSISAPSMSASSALSRLFEQPPPEPEEPAAEFSSINVHLSDSPESGSTRRKIYYLVRDYAALVLVGVNEEDSEAELSMLAILANEALEKVQAAIDEEASKTATNTTKKVATTRDQHVISTSGHTETSGAGFRSVSEHLFNGRQLLEKDPNIHEVFSRGQNPQHWHVARRGLGTDNDGKAVGGDVYLEVLRKEASLTDVDNVLMSTIRRFKEQDFSL